jgi:hypothetical protein
MLYEDAEEMSSMWPGPSSRPPLRGYDSVLCARAGTTPSEDDRAGRPSVQHQRWAGGTGKRAEEGRSEDAGSTVHAEGIFMIGGSGDGHSSGHSSPGWLQP